MIDYGLLLEWFIMSHLDE